MTEDKATPYQSMLRCDYQHRYYTSRFHRFACLANWLEFGIAILSSGAVVTIISGMGNWPAGILSVLVAVLAGVAGVWKPRHKSEQYLALSKQWCGLYFAHKDAHEAGDTVDQARISVLNAQFAELSKEMPEDPGKEVLLPIHNAVREAHGEDPLPTT